jgi:metal-responsive CopG/Arc/MetJ family transcriptional regulator
MNTTQNVEPDRKGRAPLVGFRLPVNLLRTIDALADKEFCSRSAVIRILLERALRHAKR